MKTFVVTNPELGWDCVIGVYQANSADEVEAYMVKTFNGGEMNEFPAEWVIHEQKLEVVNVV